MVLYDKNMLLFSLKTYKTFDYTAIQKSDGHIQRLDPEYPTFNLPRTTRECNKKIWRATIVYYIFRITVKNMINELKKGKKCQGPWNILETFLGEYKASHSTSRATGWAFLG